MTRRFMPAIQKSGEQRGIKRAPVRRSLAIRKPARYLPLGPLLPSVPLQAIGPALLQVFPIGVYMHT